MLNSKRFINHSGGDFRMLILADIQEHAPIPPQYENSISRLIEHAQPHLVILLGDMLMGPLLLSKKAVRRTIESVVAPIEAKGIHYATIFGNHDCDTPVSLSWQLKTCYASELCLTPSYNERDCQDAYAITVTRNSDERPRCMLLFYDGGSTILSRHGIAYKPATQEQVEWTQAQCSAWPDVPMYIFQHVPVVEIYRLLVAVDRNEKLAIKGHGPHRGKRFILNQDKVSCGTLGEAPCPSWQDSQQFCQWTQNEQIKAAFFGHDHKNDFCGEEQKISLVQTSCAGLRCYGNDSLRGGRLVTIQQNGAFNTQMLYYNAMS